MIAMADVEDRVFEREFDITPHELYTLLLDPAERKKYDAWAGATRARCPSAPSVSYY